MANGTVAKEMTLRVPDLADMTELSIGDATNVKSIKITDGMLTIVFHKAQATTPSVSIGYIARSYEDGSTRDV